MTTSEVAAAFRVSRRTVLRWSEEGKLEAIRLGPKSFRFRVTEVEALLGTRLVEVEDGVAS